MALRIDTGYGGEGSDYFYLNGRGTVALGEGGNDVFSEPVR